ncbi:TIGR03619 family F420-dependent LLM class oxidoreductase [Aquihabitans sp. G128]|uniref:TIGR03619 family F420-dependent LLM class oxidoreductase n=1 Tax=Aquihabitans sp. G128 TaxID=2849779 RepID=UPI001C232415|nr:TIGR03619 family F420-dependent LLM class oxidoreductase [Aquihabitans sp. G128]QXC59995.1 TIGR03619 family F420-dependent LLM class oxidoreductase [Aquihabitans sp. G128]
MTDTVVPGVEPTLSIQLQNFSAEAPEQGWGPVLELARVADEVGVDRVVVSDHIAFGEQLDAYGDPASGGTAGGRQPTGPDGHWLEPLTLLAVIAGQTQRVRLGTAILLAALRTPAVLAKQAATLDVLSGGRLDLGVGIGWQREEYEVAGLDFGRRGALLDQALAVCRVLWTERSAAFADGDLRFERIHAMPEPVQPGGVPIWVSGRINARTVDRLVRFGAGWIPWGEHVADPGPGIATLRQALADAGRDPAALQVQGQLPVVRDAQGAPELAATMAGVGPLLELGITDLRFSQRWGTDLGATRDLLAATVAAFRAEVGRA